MAERFTSQIVESPRPLTQALRGLDLGYRSQMQRAHAQWRRSLALLSLSVLGILIGMTQISDAQTAGALGKLEPAAATTDLLAGRLRVRVPKAARVEPRGHSIMAAPQSVQHETRVMLDAEKERLVIMAVELFETVGADLLAAVRKDVADWPQPPAVEALTLPELRAVTVAPATHDLKREAILILSVYVASADSTVQNVSFYVNPAGGGDVKGATALARRIAATITAGPTKLQSSAGVRPLSGGLSVTLPEGFSATQQPGPDFSVHHLRKLTPLGQPPARIGIYIGGHPSYQYRQMDEAQPPVKKSTGKLLGKDIEWHSWTRGKTPTEVTTMEAIAPLGGPLKLHVFLNAATEAELSALRKVVESMTHKP